MFPSPGVAFTGGAGLPRRDAVTETATMATLEWFTLREIAERWRVSVDSVSRIIDRGDLLARKFGGQWRVHTSAVEAYEQEAKPRRRQVEARPAAVIDRGDPLGLYSSTPSPARNR
jgi:excisionase family DNA binding protein